MWGCCWPSCQHNNTASLPGQGEINMWGGGGQTGLQHITHQHEYCPAPHSCGKNIINATFVMDSAQSGWAASAWDYLIPLEITAHYPQNYASQNTIWKVRNFTCTFWKTTQGYEARLYVYFCTFSKLKDALAAYVKIRQFPFLRIFSMVSVSQHLHLWWHLI